MLNKERLLHLAEILESDASNPTGIKFDLAIWGVGAGEMDCGTKGCAVGLACLHPDFKAQGLRMGRSEPMFDGYQGWEAVDEFFGTDHLQSTLLFSDDSYADAGLPTEGAEGERAVARRIREMCAENPS